MPARPARIFCAFIFVIILILVVSGGTSAQADSSAWLTPPDVTYFPDLTAYLDVHDPQGGFIQGLQPQDVTIQEDSLTVPVSGLEELTPGVQFVIAISPGETFAIRDGMGVSRYKYFTQGFLASDWTAYPGNVDDYSLLTLGGPQLVHTSDPGLIQSMLNSYTPEGQGVQPSLEILASAMQVASDPTPRPGMERAILFITPPQDTDVSLGLQSIIASANQQNIRIYVWVLAAPEAFEEPGMAQMRNLAEQTRGAFWGFSHDEAVPDLGSLIEPLRHTYLLSYASQVTTPGAHQVIAQIAYGDETLSTQPQTFEVNLQPPKVAFVNLPLEIDRNYPIQPSPGQSEGNGELLPVDQVLTLKLDFPDGYTRPITQSRLYIDGSPVAENNQPPYDQFIWDIRPYTQDGTHTIMVEATDSLGLVGKTSEIQVNFSVPSTTQGMMVAVSQNRPLFLGAALVVVVSILVLALILGGRIRPKPHPGQPRQAKGSPNNGRPNGSVLPTVRQDKLPIGIPPTGGRHLKPISAAPGKWWQRLPWYKRKEQPSPAKAYLIPLVGYDEPTLPAPLQINADEIILGRDPHQAGLVINDASIDNVHARIHCEGKSYLITDAGTVAGTWVNYEQVLQAGKNLAHLDIIHLGRIGFRFQLSEPGPLRKISVTLMDDQQ